VISTSSFGKLSLRALSLRSSWVGDGAGGGEFEVEGPPISQLQLFTGM